MLIGELARRLKRAQDSERRIEDCDLQLTLGERFRSTNHVDMELAVLLEGATLLAAEAGGSCVKGRLPESFSSALGMG